MLGGRRTEVTSMRPWVRAAMRCGVVLAVAALALPLTATAYAAPAPDAPIAAPTVAPGPDPLADAKTTLGPLLDRLHQLYQEAEAATEQYKGAVVKLNELQGAVADLKDQVARQQVAVDDGSDLAAQLAAAQYRNGRVSGLGELLLAKDPYEAVVVAELLQEAGRSQSAFLDHLKNDRAVLASLQQQAEAALADSQQVAAEREQARNTAAKKLADVEQLVGSLTGAQRSELEQLEKQQADQAQLAFLASGALGKGERTPSAAGRKAVAFALGQLGKDYVWGGEGPDVFDCSGLTSQAWLAAGVPIPRTSQEQWAELQHVPLNQIRPGDLIVYFSGATHIAMYIGGGLIVQAPHTGDVVKVSQMGAMPILGAVRPDPGAGADDQGGAWKVPDVPIGPVRIAPAKPSTLPPLPAPTSPTPPQPVPSTVPAPPAGSTAPTASTPAPTATPSASASPSASTSPSGSTSPSSSPSGSSSPSASPSTSGSPSTTGSQQP